MLTPEYLQGAPAELEALFLRLEEDIIKDICRRIAKVSAISESAEHEILRLKELGAGTDYIKEKIAEYSGLSDEEVDSLFFDAAQSSDEFYSEVYDKANVPYTPYEYNDFFQQTVTAAVNQTKGELRNLTQSMGFSYRGSNGQIRFHTAAETYRDCLDYAVTQIAAGMTDYNTAIRNATRRLTDSGLQFVDYESGVRNHADVAARRAVLTGLSQMTGKVSEHNAAELDTDIVEVDAHPGARPDHAEWQGKWYSLSGKSKEYPSLVEVTGYGTVTGLKGANCRHDFYPVIPGISEPSYTEEELRNIDPPPFEYDGKTYTYYEATQRQRYMERSMRKTKRELLAADSTGDKDKFTEKSVLLRRQKEEYGKFSKAAGLLTQNERTQVGGFGHSQASKAAWAEKKGNIHKISSKNNTNPPPSSSPTNNNLTSPSNGGIITPNYKFTEDTSQKFRKAFNTQYDKAVKVFGEITTIDTVGVLYKPRTSGEYGEYNDNTRILSIRNAEKNYFIKTMADICKSHKESGQWSTDNARHTIRHEIGHAIVNQHKKSDSLWFDKMQEIYKLFEANKDLDDSHKSDILSIYGFDDTNEMIAECIAEYLNGNPRQLSSDVVGIILREQ